jgi:glutathione S-transferase
MYKVIGSPKTRAFRVIWMLNELGAAYEVDPIPPRNPALASLNPSLKVPILQDGNDTVIDSVAICQYLADKHEQFTNRAGTIQRAHQDSFTQFSVDDVELPLWVAAKHTFALPEEYRVPDVKRACKFDFDRAMATLSTRLGTNAYVMGEAFSVPDLVLGHCAGWAKTMGWEPPQDNVIAYFARIRERPAYIKAAAERAKAG